MPCLSCPSSTVVNVLSERPRRGCGCSEWRRGFSCHLYNLATSGYSLLYFRWVIEGKVVSGRKIKEYKILCVSIENSSRKGWTEDCESKSLRRWRKLGVGRWFLWQRVIEWHLNWTTLKKKPSFLRRGFAVGIPVLSLLYLNPHEIITEKKCLRRFTSTWNLQIFSAIKNIWVNFSY